MKSWGAPFEYHVLLLVMFANKQSCRDKEGCIDWPLFVKAPINHRNQAKTPTIIEVYLSQNPTNGNTRFLRGVPIDGLKRVERFMSYPFRKL